MTLPKTSEISVQPKASMSNSSKDEHALVPALPTQEEKTSQIAVFGTVELLENILVHLPVRSIYKVREVGREWHTLVATSPKILEKLFVRVNQPKTVWRRDSGAHKWWESSTYEWSLAPPGCSISSITSKDGPFEPWTSFAGTRVIDVNPYVQPVRLNPLLRLHSGVHFWQCDDSGPRLSLGLGEEVVLNIGQRDHGRPHSELDGLALSSQLSDPPTTHAVVRRIYHTFKPGEVGKFGEMRVSHILKSASGVTLRDVISSIEKAGTCCVAGKVEASSLTLADFTSSPSFKAHKFDSHRLNETRILLCASIVPWEDEWESIAAGQKIALSRA